MPGSEFRFRADDGVALLGRRWLPEGRPRAVVQIAHGLAEHSARYARLAGALNAAGYAVYANDHRGHGPSSAPADLGHFADADGWAKTVGDLWNVQPGQIAAEQPGVPIVFLGHSMGSFLGQAFVAEHSDTLAGAALSGSNGKPPAIATAGQALARVERLRLASGARARSSSTDVVRRLQQVVRSPHAPPSTGSRATRRRSTPMSPIRCAALPSRTSSRSTCSTRCLGLIEPGAPRPHPQGPADLCVLRRARPRRSQYRGPHRGAESRGLHQAHDPHLSGRPPRDPERDQPRRGDAGPDRMAGRGGPEGRQAGCAVSSAAEVFQKLRCHFLQLSRALRLGLAPDWIIKDRPAGSRLRPSLRAQFPSPDPIFSSLCNDFSIASKRASAHLGSRAATRGETAEKQ